MLIRVAVIKIIRALNFGGTYNKGWDKFQNKKQTGESVFKGKIIGGLSLIFLLTFIR
jgi:hypothetical protein